MNHYGFFNCSDTLLTASTVSQGVLLVVGLPPAADNHLAAIGIGAQEYSAGGGLAALRMTITCGRWNW